MYIVRYADGFKIFCKTRRDAVEIRIAVTQWLSHRLKLQVSEEKTGIPNLKRKYCEFLLIQKPNNAMQLFQRINVYNSMVIGIQNYYCIANEVCKDFRKIQNVMNIVIERRLNTSKMGILKNEFLRKRYGKSKQVIWLMNMPIVPIGYCKCRNPMNKRIDINQYTSMGRLNIYISHQMLI